MDRPTRLLAGQRRRYALLARRDARRRTKRLILASSCAVNYERTDQLITEAAHTASPNNPYGHSMLAGRPRSRRPRACLLKIGGVLPDHRWMPRTGVISDELWELIEPELPCGAGRQGRPWRDHRRVLEAIAWRFRTGCPWRDVPVEFGPWQTLWKRHRRWSTDGTYQLMFDRVLESQTEAGRLDWLLSVDSTIVRAHQHAAGAPDPHHTGGRVE
jgi:putative transposase